MFRDYEKFKKEGGYALAVFVGRTTHGNNHAGIVIKQKDAIRFFHLAWHKRYCSESESDFDFSLYEKLKWVSFSSIDSIRVKVYISRLYTHHDRYKNDIKYGVNFKNTKFTETGIEYGENENGLTCATFVVCFFGKYGPHLVDLETWQLRSDDLEWKTKIIGFMESSKNPVIDCEHIKRVFEEPLNYRVRPEEVAAASSLPFSELPAKFEYCKVNGAVFNSI